MWQLTIGLASWIIILAGSVCVEPARAAYPSANVQFLPAFVSLEKGFYKREGLDAELISVRNAVTAVQALIGNQIQFIFSVGPQMPSIWEGSDIILLPSRSDGRRFQWWSLLISTRSPI
jgi:ABC-type nitrate/sulfonate/bicarbonate transport system substrate-binding protein